MNKIIPIPTVGRKVWYYPSTDEHDDDSHMIIHKRDGEAQPLDATVIAVYADDIVNLVIFDIHGHIFARRNVKLLADGERRPSMGRYATWMPYQISQAKKDHPEAPKMTTNEFIAKAQAHDEAMEKLTQVGVPLGLTLVGRIEWMMANGAKPPSPLEDYPLADILDAYESVGAFDDNGVAIIESRIPFTKSVIREELQRRGNLPVPEVDPNDPPRPMLHYGIEELRTAWGYVPYDVVMPDKKVFNKDDIDAELRYRGDTYGSPRRVASKLVLKTKTA